MINQFILYAVVFVAAWIVSSLNTKAQMKKHVRNIIAGIQDARRLQHPVVELTGSYKAGWSDCISAVNREMGDL